MRASGVWRYLALLAAGGTMIGGIIGLCFGGSPWPTTIGAVACCVLGEVWRWQGRRELARLVERLERERLGR